MPPSPDDPSHATLIADVVAYAEGVGFAFGETPYHAVMPAVAVRRIQRIYTRESLYLRARADHILVHTDRPVVFELEAKTNSNPRHRNAAIEVLPVYWHMQSEVACLYAYRDVMTGGDHGFWTHDAPTPTCVNIPDMWPDDLQAYAEAAATFSWPGLRVNHTPRNHGSGDPYLLIDEVVMRALPEWRALIDEKVPQAKRRSRRTAASEIAW